MKNHELLTSHKNRIDEKILDEKKLGFIKKIWETPKITTIKIDIIDFNLRAPLS